MTENRIRQQSESHDMHSQLDHLRSAQHRQVQHVTLKLPISFDKFTSAFQAKLPSYDLKLLRTIDPFDHGNITKHFTAVLNGQPFAIFAQRSFGLLDTVCPSNLNGDGTPKAVVKGMRYDLGNVLLAMAMTAQDMSVALYVPLSIAVWEDAVGCAVVEWDCLADQIGQVAGETGTVKEIATQVDRQREQVVWEVYEEALEMRGES